MNKRGQFYLVAAIVIVSIIIGVVTISNYAKQDESTKIYDLSEELGIEGDQVLEYGLVNQGSTSSGNSVSIKNLFEDFTKRHSTYISDDTIKIFFIFGNRTSISVVTYNELSGSFSVGESQIAISGGTSVQQVTPKNDQIKVIIEGVEHTFDLQPGENFYYIISQESSSGSVNVVTSKDK